MNKTIDALHYSRKAACECMQIFFRVVHFLQDTCGSFIYTKLRTRWQQTNSASLCVINFFLPEQVIFFTRRLSRSECVVFICATSTGRSKHKQTLIAKQNVFYETCQTYGIGKFIAFGRNFRFFSALPHGMDSHASRTYHARVREIRIMFSYMQMNEIFRKNVTLWAVFTTNHSASL